MATKKIYLVVNVDWFFLSHRLPIALAALKAGYDVTIVSRDTGRSAEIMSYGLKFIHIPFIRSGTNVIKEFNSIFQLFKLYRKDKPDLLHHVTIKVAIYGSIAAKFARLKRVVNAISGLGYNFTEQRSGITQTILLKMMKFGFRNEDSHFIFQNNDDVKVFKDLDLVNDHQITLIKGSGVDLTDYAVCRFPTDELTRVLLPARMLHDKGVIEYIKAVKMLKEELVGKAQFLLAGDIDVENLAAIKEDELKAMMDGEYLKWVGFQSDMHLMLKNSSIVVLPSYREGLPKSLIEAAAIGRPIITTNVPGCKECVIEGYNGFLVPAKDVDALRIAMRKLILDKDLITKMGLNSRLLAEKEFSLDNVVEKTINVYKKMIYA